MPRQRVEVSSALPILCRHQSLYCGRLTPQVTENHLQETKHNSKSEVIQAMALNATLFETISWIHAMASTPSVRAENCEIS